MNLRNWFLSYLACATITRSRRQAPKPRPHCPLGLEALEDRVVPASLSHLYTLNGTLTDQLGGPSLVADGGVLSATRYSFGPNQGLELTGALSTSNWSCRLPQPSFRTKREICPDRDNGLVSPPVTLCRNSWP